MLWESDSILSLTFSAKRESNQIVPSTSSGLRDVEKRMKRKGLTAVISVDKAMLREKRLKDAANIWGERTFQLAKRIEAHVPVLD